MPYYKGFFDTFPKGKATSARRRAAAGLLTLRRQLRKDIPARTVENTLLLATWNLREFGVGKDILKSKYGNRLDESIQYIAEIVNHFDLVAIQEVKDNLADLKRLVRVLGSWWDYIVTDVVAGGSGNSERFAYLYDTRKVRFDHMAGEVTLPGNKSIVWQLARTPFLCTFRAGWRRFSLCNVHIYYGTNKPNVKRRIDEIDRLGKFLASKSDRRQTDDNGEPESLVLLGDFNIFSQKDETYKALLKHKFIVPITKPTNIRGDKVFDQIAFHDPKGRLWPKKELKKHEQGSKSGVFRFLSSVFRDKDMRKYKPEMRKTCGAKYERAQDKKAFFKQWRTYQMSDHCPLWVELCIDYSDAFIPVAGGLVPGRGVRAKEVLAPVK